LTEQEHENNDSLLCNGSEDVSRDQFQINQPVIYAKSTFGAIILSENEELKALSMHNGASNHYARCKAQQCLPVEATTQKNDDYNGSNESKDVVTTNNATFGLYIQCVQEQGSLVKSNVAVLHVHLRMRKMYHTRSQCQSGFGKRATNIKSTM
jgi:hypothetical protein